MSQGDGYVTITLKRTDLGVIVSALGTEAERWRKRAHGLKPNGEPWGNAVKNASRAMETKQNLLRYVQKYAEVARMREAVKPTEEQS
jgi:hypothetical protein